MGRRTKARIAAAATAEVLVGPGHTVAAEAAAMSATVTAEEEIVADPQLVVDRIPRTEGGVDDDRIATLYVNS